MENKQQNILCTRSNTQQGFTLVEFMVASVLGLVVIAGAGSLYSYTKRLNDVGMARVATLQDLRVASTMIGQDARSAGVFGCASLGRRYAPDTTDAEIHIHQPTMPEGTKLDTLDNATTPAAGVRWVDDSTVVKNIINSGNPTSGNNKDFTPKGGALLFYYGEGSLAYKSGDSTSSKVTFSTSEGHPNKIVENVFTTGGYLVAAGCNALQLEKVNKVSSKPSSYTVTLDSSIVNTKNDSYTSSSTLSTMPAYADMILQRYKVVAYVVGEVKGEPDSLYRFEFGNNGDQWSAPQQVAKNVNSMTAEFLFVTECKTGVLGAGVTDADNTHKFYWRTPTATEVKNGAAISDPVSSGTVVQGPSAVHLTLNYDFPKVRGGGVESGPAGQNFEIVAVVRGGNVCASRKLSQQ